MEWVKAGIVTTSLGIEPVCAMLSDCGVSGVQIIDEEEMQAFLKDNPFNWDYVDEGLLSSGNNGEASVIFYLNYGDGFKETLSLVESRLKDMASIPIGIDLGKLLLVTEVVDDEEWLNKWKEFYKPFQIGQRVIIKPFWEDYIDNGNDNKDNKIIFNIDPGHAFGTGLHQTTRLCVLALEKYFSSCKEPTVALDLGCGSGILSIIALLLGAEKATAIDIDPNAVNVALENAKRNNLDESRFTTLHGNILKDDQLFKKVSTIKYDLILANIVADIIIEAAPLAKACIKEGGIFITSGIIKERVEDATAGLVNSGFEILSVDSIDDWYSITCKGVF